MHPSKTLPPIISTVLAVLAVPTAHSQPKSPDTAIATPSETQASVEISAEQQFKNYTQTCETTDATQCTPVAYAYEKGAIVPKDLTKAASLYRKACDADEELACNRLGHFYEFGTGVPKDILRAQPLYTKSCSLGLPEACTRAGQLFLGLKDHPKNYTSALPLLTQACKGNSNYGFSAHGCASLALMHGKGKATPKDPKRALQLFQKACNGGLPKACNILKTIQSKTPKPNPKP